MVMKIEMMEAVRKFLYMIGLMYRCGCDRHSETVQMIDVLSPSSSAYIIVVYHASTPSI